MTRDIIAFRDPQNLYQYCESLPTTLIDPRGLLTIAQTCDLLATGCSGKIVGCFCFLMELINFGLAFVPPLVLPWVKAAFAVADCACDLLSAFQASVCGPWPPPGCGWTRFTLLFGAFGSASISCMLDFMGILAGPIFSSPPNVPNGNLNAILALIGAIFAAAEEGELHVSGVGSGAVACGQFIYHALKGDFSQWWNMDCP